MNDATLIADLVRAGLDPELVGRVANAIADAASGGIRVDIVAEKRRAWEREYRRKRKENPPDSTRNPPDTNSALSLSSSPSIQNSKKEGKKERARGERLPPDWQPNAGHVAAGEQLGFSEREVGEQAQDMRLWAESNQHRAIARKSDWDMTFLGWLRRNKPKANGHGRNGINGTPRNGGDLARELAAEVREREHAAGLFRPDDAERGR